MLCAYIRVNFINLKGKPMKKLSLLLAFALSLSAGCASQPGRQNLSPKAIHRGAIVPSDLICSPVWANGLCQIDSTENSISSTQNGVKITLRFLNPAEKKEKIRGGDVFSENIFTALSVSVQNVSKSKIRVPFSKAVLICGTEQLDVLSYKAAILLAVSSTAEYAQRAAEPYLRAGLSPTYARQQVVNQSFQAIYRESGLIDYEWMDEKPTVTIFPTVVVSRLLLWDTAKLKQKIEKNRQIRVIIPDVVLKFDPAGDPSETVDFWFDFQIQQKGAHSQ